MPDITMCSSTDCKLRFKCDRSKDSGTRPSEVQAWCDYYKSGGIWIDEYEKLQCNYFKEKK